MVLCDHQPAGDHSINGAVHAGITRRETEDQEPPHEFHFMVQIANSFETTPMESVYNQM